MEVTNLFVLFIIGFVLGCVLVMLLWMASPTCLSVPWSSGGEGAQANGSANITYPAGASTEMVIRDSSGKTIATTGDTGTTSTFTDENGKVRNVICYASYYCVDETTCDEDECIAQGQRCSSAYTNALTSASQCCEPYECINGYCLEEEECVKEGRTCTTGNDCCEGQCTNGICGAQECQQENGVCGYVYPTPVLTAMVNQTPTYYGECCEGFECVNNKCGSEEESCVKDGAICGKVQDPAVLTHVAYKDYGECCSPDECVGNVCTGEEEEPCVETGAMCGYWPLTTSYATMVANRTYHGDCCEGNICTDGYCVAECVALNDKCSADSECCEGYECQNGVCEKPCVGLAQTCATGQIDCCDPYFCVGGSCASCEPGGYSCSVDSECCEGYTCQDKRCAKYHECVDEDEKCGDDNDCCGGLACSDNGVCIECASEGETCGSQATAAGGAICCGGTYCYGGECKEETDRLCTDTESGPGYYTQGTATGLYNGKYSKYTDYCSSTSITLFEYYCDAPGEYGEVLLSQYTCLQGCSDGACLAQ